MDFVQGLQRYPSLAQGGPGQLDQLAPKLVARLHQEERDQRHDADLRQYAEQAQGADPQVVFDVEFRLHHLHPLHAPTGRRRAG